MFIIARGEVDVSLTQAGMNKVIARLVPAISRARCRS